jgi:peptidoglycan/LPS O-acetylase OafA/YrhL
MIASSATKPSSASLSEATAAREVMPREPIAPVAIHPPRRTGFGRYAHEGRSLPLDMLRGIAILLVLGRHYVVAPTGLGPLEPLAAVWTTIGWSGVDLFFVLSGFLVSGLLFAEYRKRGEVDIRRFVIRRGFKIWPPYFVYLGVVALWIGWQYRHGRSAGLWSELWPNFFHVQNYFHTPRVHTWSLAVEEHFYLVIALLFATALARGRAALLLRMLPLTTVIAVMGLAGLRLFTFFREGPEQMNLFATHLRFDGLLIGTLLAYATHFHAEKLVALTRRPLTCIAAGVAFAAPTLALSPEANPWTVSIGLTGVYIGFALLLLGWLHAGPVHAGWRRMLGSRPAAMLGQIGFYSYSIYLWHTDLAQTPIKKLVALTALPLPAGVVWLLATTVYVAAATMGGMLLARAFEMPSLALRDRLFPSAIKPVGRELVGAASERKM